LKRRKESIAWNRRKKKKKEKKKKISNCLNYKRKKSRIAIAKVVKKEK
jgi:hypothetical protein